MFFTKRVIYDLVRDSSFSKHQIAGIKTEGKKFLPPNTKITFYRERDYFSEENIITFYSDNKNLLIKKDLKQYEPSEWRLFMVVA